MKFTKELIEKAKQAKSAEELLELAKSESVELTAEEAKKVFADLHKTGELSDEELDNVSGGCGPVNRSPSGRADTADKVVHLYQVGQVIEYCDTDLSTERATILELTVYTNAMLMNEYYPTYTIKLQNSKTELRNVGQRDIQIP